MWFLSTLSLMMILKKIVHKIIQFILSVKNEDSIYATPNKYHPECHGIFILGRDCIEI